MAVVLKPRITNLNTMVLRIPFNSISDVQVNTVGSSFKREENCLTGQHSGICFQEGSKLIQNNCDRVPGKGNEHLSFLEHVEPPPQMNTQPVGATTMFS